VWVCWVGMRVMNRRYSCTEMRGVKNFFPSNLLPPLHRAQREKAARFCLDKENFLFLPVARLCSCWIEPCTHDTPLPHVDETWSAPTLGMLWCPNCPWRRYGYVLSRAHRGAGFTWDIVTVTATQRHGRLQSIVSMYSPFVSTHSGYVREINATIRITNIVLYIKSCSCI
jgi:hypothetical protein